MRGPRICYPGAVLHVINRFVDRHPFFKRPEDYRMFLDVYFSAAKTFGVKTYAYGLMPNHFHFVLETPSGDISRFLQRFLTCAAKKLNRTYGRTGHLFAGRSKTLIVQTDRYFRTVIAYVLLNPVRAGLAKDIFSYRWSSVGEMLGERPSRLDMAGLWAYLFDSDFGARPIKRRIAEIHRWLEDVDEESNQQAFEAAHRGGFLADKEFRQNILTRIERRKKRMEMQNLRKTDVRPSLWKWTDMDRAARQIVEKVRRLDHLWRNRTIAAQHIRWYLAHEGAGWSWEQVHVAEGHPGRVGSRYSVAVSRIRLDSRKGKIAEQAVGAMMGHIRRK
ncbi:MAG: hypothetical protein A3G34_11750 [Candidatus Lindowbacteria bacterium RIFCSPLOWO2_12_FULL_62_27]|nr:MAG: hypothetical protein A3G34_11750 [Candidatus Lindowbacteria bacterium RIFCSPLOWO2_12_FULL_62_27]OGH56164.1 MAG: hypothetical protein A3I06_01790 [Candidatus Lindowbacteria bacterium RIFCSPLOWO2_02_FULL_62_12]